jgi:tRNA U34 5-carboxymethylaminomethyl modifying enzyme MnmG/GidA
MQQQEAAELREQLGTMGLMFDASGAITNYAAATSAALQQYAAAIEQYNAGLIDETTLKVYEKSYENFKKLLERYDKLYYTEMQDTQDKLDEIRRKELANNLKAWEVEIQIHLDKEKMKRDWNDFLKDIKQDFRKVFSDLTIDVKYDEKNFKSFVNDVGTTIKAINDVEAEIDKMMNGGSSTMFESVSQAQEKLKELQEKLLEQGKSLYDLYKQV